MQNLKFTHLRLLSNSTKSANQFKFSPSLNLITANENSVGKSTLVKMLLWGLGCEPSLDSFWTSLDCKVQVGFVIANRQYEVQRYKNIIHLREDAQDIEEFTKITGEYSKRFAEIVNFRALLPNKSTDLIETPPPNYYFLPFYIDQKLGWSIPWNNFERLSQYGDWKKTIIKWHIGLLPPSYFDLEWDKSMKKEEQKIFEENIKSIDIGLAVVESYIPQVPFVANISEKEFVDLTDEVKEDLRRLQSLQENALDKITILNTEKVYLEQQTELARAVIKELEKDYLYSIENIIDDEVECPLCGTIHENSIVNRTSIITDKIQAENQLLTLEKDLKSINEKVNALNSEILKVGEDINRINNKYLLMHDGPPAELVDIIGTVAGDSIRKNILKDRSQKVNDLVIVKDEIKQLNRSQKEVVSVERSEEIEGKFMSLFAANVDILDAKEVNFSAVKSALSYNQIFKEGGAAQGARAILAYYLTVFDLIIRYGNETISPLIIDTPNQHEQSNLNYEKILEVLFERLSGDQQIFLCGMNNSQLNQYKNSARVFELTYEKLLLQSQYEEVRAFFNV